MRCLSKTNHHNHEMEKELLKIPSNITEILIFYDKFIKLLTVYKYSLTRTIYSTQLFDYFFLIFRYIVVCSSYNFVERFRHFFFHSCFWYFVRLYDFVHLFSVFTHSEISIRFISKIIINFNVKSLYFVNGII